MYMKDTGAQTPVKVFSYVVKILSEFKILFIAIFKTNYKLCNNMKNSKYLNTWK